MGNMTDGDKIKIRAVLCRSYTNGKVHTKRCSTLLVIWEMQIKTKMGYQVTSIRIIIFLETIENYTW